VNPIKLSSDQALVYLNELTDMLYGLTEVLLAAGRLCETTPELAPPQAMLSLWAESRESLTARYTLVYDALHESYTTNGTPPGCTAPQAGLGTTEL